MRVGSYAAFLLLVAQDKYAFSYDGRALKKVGSGWKPASRANRNGYRRVPFHLGGQRFEVMEHIAYWIFVTDQWPKKGQQVNHKDLDRSNGRFNNLELVTQSQNIKHAHKMRKAGIKGGKR